MKENRVGVTEDLVMEILVKLPVKSLTRFKCICKYWYSCFETPYFISKHYGNNLRNNNLNLLLKRQKRLKGPRPPMIDDDIDIPDCMIDDIQIPFFSQLSIREDDVFCIKQNIHLSGFEFFSEFDVYGPCHGLLCLYDPLKIALWNPSTREFKFLPPAPSSLRPRPYHDLFCTKTVGFGFDSKTDDYKLIQFVSIRDTQSLLLLPTLMYQIDLYSLKSNSWKEISSLEYPTILPSCEFSNNYVDGICYWLAVAINLVYERYILSFDMVNEKFSTLPLPGCFAPSSWPLDIKLFESDGSLGLIVYNTDKVFDFWAMNGAAEGVWNKQFSIESVPGVSHPLEFWKNGELFLQGTNGELFLFDPSTRELRKLRIDRQTPPTVYMKVTAYVESLVSINGRSEHAHHIIRQPV